MATAAANAASDKAITNTTTTQTEKEPSPLSQIHYETRVRSFHEQNLVYQNIVLLGDSITEGFDVTKYFPGRRVINRGIGSDVIGNSLAPKDVRGVIKRLDESVFNCSPTDVFILIGINDIAQGHNADVVEAGYREMLTKIRERRPKLKLHLQSILPSSGNSAKYNPVINESNKRIKKLADEFGCDYVDLHTPLADEKGELKAEFTRDGIHLLAPPYEIWAKIINDSMNWK